VPDNSNAPPSTRFRDILKSFEEGTASGSGEPGRARAFSTGAAQAVEVSATIKERIAALDRDRAERAARRSDQAKEIDAELAWLRSLKIVSQRLAELRTKYADAVVAKGNDPERVYTKLRAEIEELVPASREAWKEATSVWYGKRGDTLQRVDNGIARVRSVLAAPSQTTATEKSKELLAFSIALYEAVNDWSAKKLGTTREKFAADAAELEDRRLKNPVARAMYTKLRRLGAVCHTFTRLLETSAMNASVQEARMVEMVRMFETLEFDGPAFQVMNLASAGSAARTAAGAVETLLSGEGARAVCAHVSLELKTQALKEAANVLDVFGVVDGLSALWNAYKAYDYMKTRQTLENRACVRLDDSMMLNMIDTLQSQIQVKCEQAAESAVVYAAAAAAKAATSGAAAPVAEALKALNKLRTVIEQIAITAYERTELLAIDALDRTRQRDQFVRALVTNVTMTCYYIRLAAPENLLRPMSYSLYQLDGGTSFKLAHDTAEMSAALADVLELKQCADAILMGWNTEIKHLHHEAAASTPLDDMLRSFPKLEPSTWTRVKNALSKPERAVREELRLAKEQMVAAFNRKLDELKAAAHQRVARSS
jgi:hypothetical protein